VTQVRRFAEDLAGAARSLAKMAEAPFLKAERVIHEIHHISPLPWFALGALLSGVAFLIGVLLLHH